MDWKRRRTLPNACVKKVAIVGGTHGNETNGVHLAKHFMRNMNLVKRPSFETEVLLSNLEAVKNNTRYVEEDLNRCYLLADLQNDEKSQCTKERKRARETSETAGSSYQWWTHSVQDATMQHSGVLVTVEKIEKDASQTMKRHYLRLMCNMGKKGRCSQAFQAAEEMKKSGLEMDVPCYAALVEACLRAGLLDAAMETFQLMRKELGPTCALPEETHNEFISACGFADQWSRSVELLKDLRKQLVPQICAYFSAVRSCCRCKQYPVALQLLKEMEKHSQGHYEVDATLGPKSSDSPKCDLIIDLHNTTANTGVALLMAPDDEFAHEIGHHLMGLDDSVRVVEWNDQPDWPLCPSIGRSGLTFEVGACPWGCIEPELFQTSRRLIMALLDYVDRHNGLVSGGSVPARREEVTMPVYRSIGVSMDYPRTAGGDPTGHVHPSLQNKDFKELRDGDPLFMTFDGDEVKFDRKAHKVPEKHEKVYALFVNEAAYYEKKIALMLMSCGESKFSRLTV